MRHFSRRITILTLSLVVILILMPYFTKQKLVLATVEGFGLEHAECDTAYFFFEKAVPNLQTLTRYSNCATAIVLSSTKDLSMVGWDKPLFIPKVALFGFIAKAKCEIVAGEESKRYEEYYVWYILGWKRFYHRTTGLA